MGQQRIAKLLIADDEPNILMLSELIFKELGMDVLTAVDGQDAIEKAIKYKPDLIITDIVMPNKNGFEVCQAVRNTPEIENTPIIILSAMGDEYNKITGFEEGANDYVVKPFNIEELKARVKALLVRFQHQKKSAPDVPVSEPLPADNPSPTIATKPLTETLDSIERNPTGIPELDHHLGGGIPKGSNILVIGKLGRGKSSFARKFIVEGLKTAEKCLFVALDDNPQHIRHQLNQDITKELSELEDRNVIKFVDAYSWTTFTRPENESFCIDGMLDLNQLSGIISDASHVLGQTIQSKLGGRRIIDSISSLLINFELPAVQRFLSQIARTAVSFGGVSTLFIMEGGTVDEQVLNNIKYIMDGVIEFEEIEGRRVVRVASMKWAQYDSGWVALK